MLEYMEQNTIVEIVTSLIVENVIPIVEDVNLILGSYREMAALMKNHHNHNYIYLIPDELHH